MIFRSLLFGNEYQRRQLYKRINSRIEAYTKTKVYMDLVIIMFIEYNKEEKKPIVAERAQKHEPLLVKIRYLGGTL